MDEPGEARQRAGDWLWPRDNAQLLDQGTGWMGERLWCVSELTHCRGQGSTPQGTELGWH